jgi:hypothetical protein
MIVNLHALVHWHAMPKYSPELKHRILTRYTSDPDTNSYRSLSLLYGLAPDGRTIKRWKKQWNGTLASLRDKQRSGRPRLLTRQQVHSYIRQPVVASNRSHTPINYPTLHTRISQTNAAPVSLRSVQRYGASAVGIKPMTTRLKTAHESNSVSQHTHHVPAHASSTGLTICSNVCMWFCVTPNSVISAL